MATNTPIPHTVVAARFAITLTALFALPTGCANALVVAAYTVHATIDGQATISNAFVCAPLLETWWIACFRRVVDHSIAT